MTQEQIKIKLRQLGLLKLFKVCLEAETGTCLLATKEPARIIDGILHGSEIALMRDNMFLVWTGRRRLAQEIAKRHKLNVRLLDGEAQIWVPPNLADELLPKFGAKVKRQPSQKQLEVLKRARQLSPALHSMQKNPCATDTSDASKVLPGALLSPQPQKRRISHPKSN